MTLDHNYFFYKTLYPFMILQNLTLESKLSEFVQCRCPQMHAFAPSIIIHPYQNWTALVKRKMGQT